MNDQIIYGILLGGTVGFLLGYIVKQIQDTNYISEISDIKDEVIKDIKAGYKVREELYKEDINRLHEMIANQAVDRIREKPMSAKLRDLYEISLGNDGYQEIDFPNGGLNDAKE